MPPRTEGPPRPPARGDLSAVVVAALGQEPGIPLVEPPLPDDLLLDADLHLALRCCYGLHQEGFAGVAPGWEWDPTLLAWRRRLEAAFEAALRHACTAPPEPVDLVAELRRFDTPLQPSLIAWLEANGERRHLWELAVQRSLDERRAGVGDPVRRGLWIEIMATFGLDPTYGAYLDRLPAPALAVANLSSLFGINRHLRGALLGLVGATDLATRNWPERAAAWLRRVGLTDRLDLLTRSFPPTAEPAPTPEGLAEPILATEPHLAAEVVFGATASQLVEAALARWMIGEWEAGRSSLLGQPVAGRP